MQSCTSFFYLSQKYGTGKSEIEAKVWYLTSVKHYPLYGSTLFNVLYKGFWPYPSNILLGIDLKGVKFVNTKTKQIMAEYDYQSLDSIGVDIVEDAVTLKMKEGGREDLKLFNFETAQKEDIANLIGSYSPSHSNWQRVGEAKIKQVSTSI